MYLAIEGVIGVGKTTLSRLLQPAFESDLVLEVFEENPFLSSFYADRERYAFLRFGQQAFDGLTVVPGSADVDGTPITGIDDNPFAHGLGQIGAEDSLVRVSSTAFQVSAIKRAEDGDGLIVRVYNTLDDEASTTIDVPLAKGSVCRVNLNEEHVEDVDRNADGVHVTARRNEIVTLRWKWE
jgi:hypothetical protein